jgi:hypothetical protein
MGPERRNAVSESNRIPKNAIIDPMDATVLCPKCRDSRSHIVNVFTRLGVNPNEAVVYPGTQALGVVPTQQGSCLVIVFEGECGHVFEWRIQLCYGDSNFVHAKFIRSLVQDNVPFQAALVSPGGVQ